jgi:putative transposase
MPAESTTCVRRLDELYTAYPLLGSRRMTAVLRAEELSINRKRVHSG